eukprot:1157627-Pelagomonas_calceolata.AAC.2
MERRPWWSGSAAIQHQCCKSTLRKPKKDDTVKTLREMKKERPCPQGVSAAHEHNTGTAKEQNERW